MARKVVRIGCGSGGLIDRVEDALDMVAKGNVRYLCMDTLSERTLALFQIRMLERTGSGFDPRVPAYTEQLLPLAREHAVKIIANMGGANPSGVVEYFQDHAREFGLGGIKVGLIEGDNVLDTVVKIDPILTETGQPLSKLKHRVVCANAYLGYEPIAEALSMNAEVVIGGRIADSSLGLAPLVYEFGWRWDDWHTLGAATAIGHLLECTKYITGAQVADPPYRVMDSWENSSMPLADVNSDGTGVIRKLPGSGGALTPMECKLVFGYEIEDPSCHPTPDVMLDLSHVRAVAVEDGVAIDGATGTIRPKQLKILVGVAEGFIAENQVSYAGLGAVERGNIAREILEKRFEVIGAKYSIEEWRIDLLGLNSVHGSKSLIDPAHPPYEVHVRAAARCSDRKAAEAFVYEVEYLMLWGPAGTCGGHKTRITPIVSTFSTYLDRSDVPTSVSLHTL